MGNETQRKTEFFRAEVMIYIAFLCCQATIHLVFFIIIWGSELKWSWGELQERSNACQDHCVGEGDVDGGGGGGGREAKLYELKGMELGESESSITGAASF